MHLDIQKKNSYIEKSGINNRKIRPNRVNDHNMSYFITEMIN
jgi:hypothetical protein